MELCGVGPQEKGALWTKMFILGGVKNVVLGSIGPLTGGRVVVVCGSSVLFFRLKFVVASSLSWSLSGVR